MSKTARIARPLALAAFALLASGATVRADAVPRGTGDLGVIIERANGAISIVETTGRTRLARVEGLGDLSHASVVFSRDERFAYVFGRDGGLTKVDLLAGAIDKRIIQGGNAIGGAISDDGRLIAVSNYTPGGVRVFDANTLDLLADIPALGPDGQASKTVGLVDVPGRAFMVTLFEAGEIWKLDFWAGLSPVITKLSGVGKLPYDANVTVDGRNYYAGLFGEDGVVHVDLWAEPLTARRVLDGYGKGEAPLPVYKMPHFEGWAAVQGKLYLPAIGREELLIVDASTGMEAGRVAVHGQPVFVVGRPDGRHLWVNFAHPKNDVVQVVDTVTNTVVKTLKPGPAVLHMEFTPRGHEAWVSVRDRDQVIVYDARTFEERARLSALKPSGIFFTARAHRIGQ
jgi:protein NirF